MGRRSLTTVLVTLICLSLGRPGATASPLAPVGAAKIDITPAHPTLLAGYGSRTEEATEVDARLWARALALGSDDPAVLVAVDNCGVPAAVVARVAAGLAGAGVRRERLVVCSTHTHTAPTLTGYAPVLWEGRASPAQLRRVDRYTDQLVEWLIDVSKRALAAREPCRLAWGRGRVALGGNRRVLRDGRWSGFGFQRDGPVDHALPVLVASDARGRVRAIWTSYACHCTTVGARNWETSPADRAEQGSGESTTFVFLGGLGWQSQPQAAGFALLVGDEEVVSFDVARAPARWRGVTSGAELLYFPTWVSDEDSGGFFFLTLPARHVTPGKACPLGVRSQGSGSQRWFALDALDPTAWQRALETAFAD